MFEILSALALIMQNSFVDSVWGAIVAFAGIATTISLVALFWVQKVRSIAERRGNKKLVEVLDQVVIPLLQDGTKLAEITARQEVKAKQLGEIIYNSMGDKANEIRDKTEVKIVNLTKDVKEADELVKKRNEEAKKAVELIEEIKEDVKNPPEPATIG